MLPALEDVADLVGDPRPVETDPVDDLAEGNAVLRPLAPAGREPSGGDGERTEPRAVEPPVDRARERGVRDDDEVAVGDLGVDPVDGLGPGEGHVPGEARAIT